MAVYFECPHCGERRAAARYIQGQRVRCPNCDALVDVPASQIDSLEEALPVLGEDVGVAEPEDTGERDLRTTSPEDDGPRKLSLRKARPMAEAEMDMTPMVDVTFLLLIFFMVTAAFALQKSLQIPKPEPPDESAQARTFQVLEDNPDYVTVYIDAYGTYRVTTADWDREAISKTELLRQLREARSGLSGGKVPTHLIVKAEGEATQEKVVAALDAGTAVGMEDVQLVTVDEPLEP